MDDLRRLLILEEIRILQSRYWRYLDTRQWDKLASLFTDDCVFDAPLDDFTPDPGGQAIAKAIEEGLQGGTSVHQGMHHEIEVLDDTHARGIWALSDYLLYPPGATHRSESSATATSLVHGYGYYVNDYLCRDGDWLFSHVELPRIHLEVTSHGRSDLHDALKR
jgi:hypothetical protein